MRSPTFTLGALHPETPLAEKLSFPKSTLDLILMCVKFQLSSSSCRDMRGSKFTLVALRPSHVPNRKIFIPAKSTWP